MRAFITPDAERILASAQRTFDIETTALQSLRGRLDHDLVKAVGLLLNCQGRVVVTGIGKSGHIARKIAATLASTGTPAFFMHAAEALHGDLGMITADDLVIALSYSGKAQELITVLNVTRRLGIKLIAITGNDHSELAQNADLHLNVHIEQEACPLNLAPTTSTTASLVLGDALAVACLEAKGFSAEDFARSHPGGALGKQLLTFVRDVMRQGEALPIVHPESLVIDALAEMSAKGMGMTIVVDAEQRPVGIFTDGDLRRLIARQGDIRTATVSAGMTPSPRQISAQALAIEAARMMDENRINQILITGQQGQLIGALHMHDLLAAKVI